MNLNNPGTSGGPGGHDGTIKSRKNGQKSFFRTKIKITQKKIFFWHISSSYAKYWGKQIFTHGRFPEVGQKQKTEKRKKEKERKKDWTMVITMAKLRMAHASMHGARKPPGPKWHWSTCRQPSSWVKISGWKAIDRPATLPNHTQCGARKPPGPKILVLYFHEGLIENCMTWHLYCVFT